VIDFKGRPGVGSGIDLLPYLDSSLLAGEVHEEVAAVHVLGLLPGTPQIQGVQRVAVKRTLER